MWILVHTRKAMRCNAVCRALAAALFLAKGIAATNIKALVLLGWKHAGAGKKTTYTRAYIRASTLQTVMTSDA